MKSATPLPGPRRFRDPLRTVPVKYKLTLMIVVMSLMAFGVGGYLVKTTSQKALEEALFDRLHTEAQTSAFALRSELSALSSRVEDFASDGYIRARAEALSLQPTKTDALVIEAELRDHLIRNKLPLEVAFHDLAILSPEGELLLTAANKLPPKTAADLPLSTSITFSSLAHLPDSEPSPRFAITTPLSTVGFGQPIGYLVAWVNPGTVLVRALRNEDSSPAANAIDLCLFDGENQRLKVPNTWLAADGPLVDSEIVQQGIGLQLDYRPPLSSSVSPGLLYTKLYPIRGTGYSVEVSLDASEAIATVADLQSEFLAVGALLALLSFGLLIFPIRFLASPLEYLTGAARRLREGDLSARVRVDSEDELGLLGKTFNEMAEAIDERTSRLEQSAIDLRAQKRAAIQERLRLSTVISSMRNGVVVLDADGEIVFGNEAARPLRHMLRDAKLVNGPASRHPCTRENRLEHCADCLFSTELEPRACVLEFEGGTFEIHATHLAANAGGQPGRLLVSHDVTDRVAQDEREMHQERLSVLGEVAAVMAHELNNPLAAIRMYAQLIDENLSPESDLRTHVEVISRNTDNCSRTIRDLLTYATDATPETGLIDIRDILEDVISFLRPMHERAEVSLRMELSGDEEPAFVQGDELQLRQIFTNLIMNAVQALDPGGQVVVRMSLHGDHHFVEVSDNGKGIAPSNRERIFRAFFTTKPRGEGTGLGLSTARRIAELHGGGLELIDTDSPGCTFRVRLRRAAEIAV